MKLSLIHNQYHRNPYFKESVALGLYALRKENVDYEYLIFNDNGDKEIEEDAREFLSDPRVKYHYSPVNYGHKTCTGGWVGALPLITGDLIHNMGQDDVFTPMFYRIGLDLLEKDDDLMLVHFNGICCNEYLQPLNVMLSPDAAPDYYNHPVECWKAMFGVGHNGQDIVSRADNCFLAPGVIYRKKLHTLIGPPDLDNFLGAADFEFWARVLFYGYKIKSIPIPTWIYRKSNLSQSSEEGQEIKIKNWVDKVKSKYDNLYQAMKYTKLL